MTGNDGSFDLNSDPMQLEMFTDNCDSAAWYGDGINTT
jgi:hypothetical protein